MKKIFAALCLASAVATPNLLVAQESSAGRDLAELAFESLDGASRGYVDTGEFLSFGSDVFVSMDYDDNARVSLEEFMGWDFGMMLLAEERGLKASYDTALKVVFAFWDRDGDGEISATEHRRSLMRDFERADLDDNALLSKQEFLEGFSVSVALRAALAPNQ